MMHRRAAALNISRLGLRRRRSPAVVTLNGNGDGLSADDRSSVPLAARTWQYRYLSPDAALSTMT
jgi:hypothetical protein